MTHPNVHATDYLLIDGLMEPSSIALPHFVCKKSSSPLYPKAPHSVLMIMCLSVSFSLFVPSNIVDVIQVTGVGPRP